MKKPGIMILGAGLMQLPAYETAQKNGWTSIAADGNPEAHCKTKADLFLNIDLKDRVGLAEAAAELKEKYNIRGVFTCGTDFSASVAWIAEKLDLPGIPYQTALDCTDKYRMRTRFAEASVPCPTFREYSEEMDLEKTCGDLHFPLVVKPVDNMGGRGVITAENETELIKAAAEAVRFSRTRRAIIEEFMDGDEFSIDSLVYEGEIRICGFADRHIYYPPCFIEMGHTLPSSVNKETEEEIFRVFKQAVHALGITMGSAKGDIKLTSRGVMIGEIAARLSGGYMSGWTYPYASGVNLVENGMRVAMGMAPEGLEENLSMTSSERAYLSIPGKIKDLKGLDEAHNLEHVKDIFVLSDIGDEVDFPLNNVMKCGNVISVAPSRDDALNSSAQAVSMIRVKLEKENQKTRDFVSAPLYTAFPPSAYDFKVWESLGFMEDFKPDFSMKYKESPIPVPPGGHLFFSQKDWNMVKPEMALNECAAQTPGQMDFTEDAEWSLYAKHFWYALVRAGVQGALWYIEQNDEDH